MYTLAFERRNEIAAAVISLFAEEKLQFAIANGNSCDFSLGDLFREKFETIPSRLEQLSSILEIPSQELRTFYGEEKARMNKALEANGISDQK